MSTKIYKFLAIIGFCVIMILLFTKTSKYELDFNTYKLDNIISSKVFKIIDSIKSNASTVEYKTSNSRITLMDSMTLNATFPKDLFTPKAYNHSGPNLKKILFWNDAYGSKHWGIGFGQEPFLRAGCKVNTCFTTPLRDQFPLEDVDAVLWHFRSNDKSLPSKRSLHTRYIFWMMESAVYLFGNLNTYNGVFNWTMTYRLDSDIPRPYGLFKKMKYPKINSTENNNYMSNKTTMAVWFVSHCSTISSRERLVKSLSKYIQVDVYGSCGPLKCSRKIHGSCMKNAEKQHKFYLSFENSLCLDYVTEKFYGAMEYNIVPVVYGLGQYESIAPPHSYINALDFNTAKELAEYLIYLDNNPDKYNEYFQWKKYYLPLKGWAIRARSFCQMCEMLHDDTLVPHVYHNLYKWFVDDSRCLTKRSSKINRLIS